MAGPDCSSAVGWCVWPDRHADAAWPPCRSIGDPADEPAGQSAAPANASWHEHAWRLARRTSLSEYLIGVESHSANVPERPRSVEHSDSVAGETASRLRSNQHMPTSWRRGRRRARFSWAAGPVEVSHARPDGTRADGIPNLIRSHNRPG